MAIINCSIGQNSKWYKVYIEYSYTQNIAANTSTITAALKLQQLTDYNDFDTISVVSVGFNMDGTTYSSNQRINIDDKGNTGYTITLASGTKTVTHDSSGAKTISFSCSNTSSLLNCSGWGPGSITLSSTSVKLNTIPRNADINKIANSNGTAISSATIGSEIKVYYTPTVSTYYHRLLFYIDSTHKSTVNLGKAGSTSQKAYSITLPASWMSSISSGTLNCQLNTYSDSGYSTKIGSTSSASISVSVPTTATYMPTASLAITPSYNNNLNVYLKGVSKATFKITGTAGSGASVSSYSLSGSGVSSTSSSTTVDLQTAGTDLTYTATVKDSRGRTATASQKITVYDYSKPTLSNGRITRCDENGDVTVSGEYALGGISASFTSVSNKNSIASLTWSYRVFGASSWIDLGEISNGTTTKSSTTFDTNTSYQFRYTVQDAVGTVVNSGIYTMPASGRPMNIARYNNGLAIGKLSSITVDDVTQSKFECAWPAKFDDTINAPSIYQTTYSGSANTYVASDGTLGRSTSSSKRYKTDIKDVVETSLDPYNILDIPVRQFKYNKGSVPIDKTIDDLYIGFIAEEVEAAYPIAAEYNEDGQVEMWNIKIIVPAMLKVIQDQQKEIFELKQKMNELIE